MKQVLALILFSISFLFSQSQVTCDWVNVNWAPDIKNPKGKLFEMNLIDENFRFTYKKRGVFTFTEYNSNFSPLKPVVLNTQHNTNLGKYQFIRLFDFGGKKWVFSKIKNEEKLQFTFYVQEIDLPNERMIDEPIEILSINFLRNGKFERVELVENEDKNLIMMKFMNANTELTEYSFGAKIFDEKWVIKEELEYEVSRIQLNSTKITYDFSIKDGIAAVKTIEHRNEETGNITIENIELVGEKKDEYADEGKTFDNRNANAIRLKVAFQSKMKLKDSLSEEYVGLYWSQKKDNIEGIAYYQVGDSSNPEIITHNEFDDYKFFGDGEDGYVNTKAIKTKDGFYLFAEKRYKLEKRYYDERGYDKSAWKTIFADMLVAKLNTKGVLEWHTVLKKYSKMDGNHSENPNMKFGVHYDNVYVVYENYKGTVGFGGLIRSSMNPGIKAKEAFIAELNENGELIQSPLYHPNEKDIERIWVQEFYPEIGKFLITRKGKKCIQYGTIGAKDKF